MCSNPSTDLRALHSVRNRCRVRPLVQGATPRCAGCGVDHGVQVRRLNTTLTAIKMDL